MRKIDLVVIPYNDLLKGEKFGFRDRDLHLVQEIIRSQKINKLLIVERPISIFTFLDIGAVTLKKGKKVDRNLIQIGENSFAFEFHSNGVLQPFLKHLWFDKVFGSDRFISKFEEALEKNDITDPVFLVFNPFAFKLLRKFGTDKIFFDALDNLYLHPEMQGYKNYLYDSYAWISENAKLISCVSDEVIKFFSEKFPVSRNKLLLLRNGISSDFKPSGEMPKDIAKIKKPIIGYTGIISARIDFNLVEHLARSRPNYSFVFVGKIYGKIKDRVKRLKKFPNVHFIGEKHYSKIPSYIDSFDVCIIPHIVDEFTLSNDPMKLYEYLYLGKAVVTTKIGMSDEFKDFVFVAQDEFEFLNSIDMALKVSGGGWFAERQRSAIKSYMFWEKRAEFLLEKILTAIGGFC